MGTEIQMTSWGLCVFVPVWNDEPSRQALHALKEAITAPEMIIMSYDIPLLVNFFTCSLAPTFPTEFFVVFHDVLIYFTHIIIITYIYHIYILYIIELDCPQSGPAVHFV